MSILEAALRGGAVMLLLLRVAVLLKSARSSRVSRYSALLLACIAAYVVESAPSFDALDLRVRVPIHVVTSTTPAMFWMTMVRCSSMTFACAGITRSPGWRWPCSERPACSARRCPSV
jgi:hypothetical protein